MSVFKPPEKDFRVAEVDGKKYRLLQKRVYDLFNTSLLGLGDISQQSVPVDAIAAVFDLQGFTNFCKQIEPHLSVPRFLNEFLGWLLGQIKEEMTHKQYGEEVHLYGPLPFLVKFLGDGLLVIWDASAMRDVARRNVLLAAKEICTAYARNFLPTILKEIVDPPPALRCGLARGTVYSVGDGNDFVGSCINMAARLEKLPGVTFAFNKRGFELKEPELESTEFFCKAIVVKKVAIRGIGHGELIGILKKEFESLKSADKKLFLDP